jgi:putative transcriptional regulator
MCYFRNMIAPAPGILLIADPFLKDPNFLRTVVLLCDHQPEGSFGFVLNKQIDKTLGELIRDCKGVDLPVHYGGPVQTNTIHFLHQYPELLDGCNKVGEGVYWGGNFETLKALLKNNSINTDKVKFFLGYSGWGNGQLNTELDEKSWLTVNANEKLIFDTPPKDVWKSSLLHLGGDYEQLINYPADPQLN